MPHSDICAGTTPPACHADVSGPPFRRRIAKHCGASTQKARAHRTQHQQTAKQPDRAPKSVHPSWWLGVLPLNRTRPSSPRLPSAIRPKGSIAHRHDPLAHACRTQRVCHRTVDLVPAVSLTRPRSQAGRRDAQRAESARATTKTGVVNEIPPHGIRRRLRHPGRTPTSRSGQHPSRQPFEYP
jgi:hypothetical protein